MMNFRLSPHRLALLIAAALIYGGILLGSLSSEIGPPNFFPYSDKLVHMSAWALLTAVAVLALRDRRLALLGAAFLFASSGCVEVIQAFVPGRSPSWTDLIANGLGVLLSFLLVQSATHRLSSLKQRLAV